MLRADPPEAIDRSLLPATANPALSPNPARPGIFVALEGIEGSGKSTQAALLGEWLRSLGLDVVGAREPGGTPLGERVRTALLDASGQVPPRAELMLMLAARAALVTQVIEPALARGAVVLLDRFELSSFAYQGFGRGLPMDELRSANAFVTAGRRPDLTILLDVPEELGEERRRAVGKGSDRIEGAGRDFHARVAKGYRELARNEQGLVVVDGQGDAATVQARIRAQVWARFPETIGPAQG